MAQVNPDCNFYKKISFQIPQTNKFTLQFWRYFVPDNSVHWLQATGVHQEALQRLALSERLKQQCDTIKGQVEGEGDRLAWERERVQQEALQAEQTRLGLEQQWCGLGAAGLGIGLGRKLARLWPIMSGTSFFETGKQFGCDQSIRLLPWPQTAGVGVHCSCCGIITLCR